MGKTLRARLTRDIKVQAAEYSALRSDAALARLGWTIDVGLEEIDRLYAQRFRTAAAAINPNPAWQFYLRPKVGAAHFPFDAPVTESAFGRDMIRNCRLDLCNARRRE